MRGLRIDRIRRLVSVLQVLQERSENTDPVRLQASLSGTHLHEHRPQDQAEALQ